MLEPRFVHYPMLCGKYRQNSTPVGGKAGHMLTGAAQHGFCTAVLSQLVLAERQQQWA
jgi:hypothetical protein